MATLVAILAVVIAICILFKFENGLWLFTASIPLMVLAPKTTIPGINGTTVLILLLWVKSVFNSKKILSPKESIPNLKLPIWGLFLVTLFSIVIMNILLDQGFFTAREYFEKLWRWFIYIWLFFLYRKELGSEDLIKCIICGIGVGLFIEGAFVAKAVMVAGRYRSYGTIGQPNELAQFFGSYLLIPIILFLHDKRPGHKLFHGATVFLCLWGVASSLSRGGFLVTVVSLGIYMLFRARKALVICICAALIFTSGLYGFLPERVIQRIESTLVESDQGNAGGGVELERSAYSRIPLAQGGIEMFKESPLFGKGFMSYPPLIPVYKYGGQFGIERQKASHNMHVRILSELGLAGYVFFIFFFINGIRLGFKMYRTIPDPFLNSLGVALIACSSSFLIGCLFGDRFFRGILIAYFFILFAACYNAYCVFQSKQAA